MRFQKPKIAIFFVVILISGCTNIDCNELTIKLTPENSVHIEQWVYGQRPFKEALNSPLLPGVISIDLPLHEFPIKNFPRPASSSIVPNANGDIAAVFLGYRNFKGILISMIPESGFKQVPVAPTSLNFSTPNVAIVCVERH